MTHAMLEGIERDFLLAHRVGGVHAALGFLNARTRFRITALCPLDTTMMDSLAVYDRESPRVQLAQSSRELVAVARSVARDGECMHAAGDLPHADIEGRVLQAGVPSQLGALVLTGEGAVWGVLFHYDLRLRLAGPNERRILGHLGARLGRLWPAAIQSRLAGESAR